MQSFLQEVVQKIKSKYTSLDNLIFILPSKRAGNFLRNDLARTAENTFFSPEIFSIESFVEQISGLTYATNTQQLFILYQTYLDQKPKPLDTFHTFSKWGQTLLQDFNEIDRYLIDAGKLFDNLSAIQEIEHWSVQSQQTQMMRDYLQFWNHLEYLYRSFNSTLLEQGLGHQGLVYRTACEKLGAYLKKYDDKTFVFIGFNALNSAESQLVQQILDTTSSEIYWDIDRYFLDDPVHDAGHFIRQHLKTWPYLKEHPVQGLNNTYLKKKDIKIIGVPKNVSQAKYVSQILTDIKAENPEQLKSTAVVLGDETLLNPLLNSVPEEIERVNITMGYPLEKTPLASFFEQLITLYVQKTDQGWFYRNLQVFLAHPSANTLLKDGNHNWAVSITEHIKRRNWSYIDTDNLEEIAGKGNETIALLFTPQSPKPGAFIARALNIISELKARLQVAKDSMALEYLYRFHNLFNQLDELIKKYGFITDLKSFRGLFRQLLSSETLDFRGEPLEGLQLMGMLESRNLDFETVIITSVNEGILPSGKSNNSFIPFDLKVHFGLPTYKEKDAVYTYHFYRLLQRAERVFILYSTEPDDALGGGERSRLIHQLLTDENRRGDIVEINASPAISPSLKTLETIEKDAGLLELVKAHAEIGFSPTSLSNYIRNPIDFYKRSLLGINDVQEVEETVAANTFGTIVHDTLEDLYTPCLGQYLTEEGLLDAKNNVEKLVKYHFSKSYGDGDISRGKNLIASHVIVRYIKKFLMFEIEELQKHRIKILGLEQKLQIALNIPEIDFPVHLKGKLDRIDEVDGLVRIIDYKTGRIEKKNVEIVDLEKIIMDYDNSKAFQLLCYALMYQNTNPVSTLEAGIFSFKNQGEGLLSFATKPTSRSRTKDHNITEEMLSLFASELNKLVMEICDLDVPFTEKEIK